MRQANSKEKLSMMHEALDRELQQIGVHPRSSSSRRDREELRYSSGIDDPRRPPKPSVFDHTVQEADIIKNKKNEIGELERKLMELERKMDNISLSSNEDESPPNKQRIPLTFQQQKESVNNEDTARFLLETNAEARQKSNKVLYSYPSLEDQDEDEDSQDYAQVQRAIEKKKQEARELIARRTSNPAKPRSSHEQPTKQSAERKISTEVESVLKPKYSNQKANRVEKPKSIEKKSIRQSVTSKRSQEKPNNHQPQGQLKRTASKHSVKSNASNNSNSMRGSRQQSREKHDRSFERFSQKEQCLHSEEVGLAKDLKRMNNLEREAAHYKRLAQKYKEQLEEYRVMEIQLRELRKNFAKSELIRTQQKKVIETLKSKISK